MDGVTVLAAVSVAAAVGAVCLAIYWAVTGEGEGEGEP